ISFIEKEGVFSQEIENRLADLRVQNLQIRNAVTADLTQMITGSMIFSISATSLIAFSGYIIYRTFGAPLDRLRLAVSKIANGNFSVQIPESKRKDEIGSLAMAINSMQQELNL